MLKFGAETLVMSTWLLLQFDLNPGWNECTNLSKTTQKLDVIKSIYRFLSYMRTDRHIAQLTGL